MADDKPRRPEHSKVSKSGMEEGSTRGTDETRKADRPVKEEDVFGGHERTERYQDVKSGGTKP